MLILSGSSGRTDLVCFVFRSRTLSALVCTYSAQLRDAVRSQGSRSLLLLMSAISSSSQRGTGQNTLEYSYHNVRGPLNACRTHTPIRRTHISEYRIVLDRIGSWMLRWDALRMYQEIPREEGFLWRCWSRYASHARNLLRPFNVLLEQRTRGDGPRMSSADPGYWLCVCLPPCYWAKREISTSHKHTDKIQ